MTSRSPTASFCALQTIHCALLFEMTGDLHIVVGGPDGGRGVGEDGVALVADGLVVGVCDVFEDDSEVGSEVAKSTLTADDSSSSEVNKSPPAAHWLTATLSSPLHSARGEK